MREAVPNAAVMGLLVNPANPNAELDTQEAQNAARKLGLELHVVGASNAQEIDTAFATLVQQRAHALVKPAPAAHRPDGAPYDARDLRLSRIPRRRGVDELRREQCRRRSPGWHLCWPHPQGRQAGRPGTSRRGAALSQRHTG